MDTPAAPHPRVARLTAVVAVATLGLAGCGLRLESDPPEPPVPDAVEVVRDRVATEAEQLAGLAADAAATAPDPVAELLVALAAASDEHGTALGGSYVPFPDATNEPGTGTEPSPTPEPAPVGAAELIDLLTASADSAFADADAVDDGPLSRLVASVAMSRLLFAETLAAVSGEPVEPADVAVPDVVPDGVGGQQVGVLIHSEDALGLAWEVLAARFTDEDRRDAATRATAHRLRAQDWAVAAGIAGTGQDPRRSTYALPPGLTDPDASVVELLTAAGELEADLTAIYLTLVTDAAPGTRSALMDLATDSARFRVVAGAPVPVFPGLADGGESQD